jgi:hypothetical protein
MYETVKELWEGYNENPLEEYLDIIHDSISRSSMLIKRQMTELWTVAVLRVWTMEERAKSP